MTDRLTPEREAEIQKNAQAGAEYADESAFDMLALLRKFVALRAERDDQKEMNAVLSRQLTDECRQHNALRAEHQQDVDGRNVVIDRLQARAFQLEAALREHHEWHMRANPDEYVGSRLSDLTEAALAASPALTNEQMREKEAAAYVRRQQKVGPIPADPLLRQDPAREDEENPEPEPFEPDREDERRACQQMHRPPGDIP